MCFFLLPEFNIPAKQNEADTAVKSELLEVVEWIWCEGHNETMNPFGVVRRMTEQQLQRDRVAYPQGTLLPRFNCAFQMHAITCVHIGVVGETKVHRTIVLDVFCLTNSKDLE